MAQVATAPAADFVSKRKNLVNPGLYLLIKRIAYCLGCYLGLRLFHPQQIQPLGEALRFAIIRLFLGLLFGLVIFFLAAFWGHTFGTGLPQNMLGYLGASPVWRIFPSSRRLMVPFPRADSCVERSAAFLAPFYRFSVQ
jgi:hypothetical protein